MGNRIIHASLIAEFLNDLQMKREFKEDEEIQKMLDDGQHEIAQAHYEDYARRIKRAMLDGNFHKLEDLILNEDIVK